MVLERVKKISPDMVNADLGGKDYGFWIRQFYVARQPMRNGRWVVAGGWGRDSRY